MCVCVCVCVCMYVCACVYVCECVYVCICVCCVYCVFTYTYSCDMLVCERMFPRAQFLSTAPLSYSTYSPSHSPCPKHSASHSHSPIHSHSQGPSLTRSLSHTFSHPTIPPPLPLPTPCPPVSQPARLLGSSCRRFPISVPTLVSRLRGKRADGIVKIGQSPQGCYDNTLHTKDSQ